MASGPAAIRSPLPTQGSVHRVGKLRAGIKKSSTRDGKAVEYPSAVDYFVVNPDMSTSEQAAASFHEVYGDEPRALDVVLPARMPEEVLQGAWRQYGSGGLLKRKCEGPGGHCTQRGPEGVWIDGPCACDSEKLALDDKRRCAERWTLSVLLMRVTGLGVWQFDTGSSMAARDMAGMLNLIFTLRGTCLRAECQLRLVPRQVAPGGVAKTVYIAQLDASGVTPAEALALAEGDSTAVPALPPPALDEAPDELLDHEAAATSTPPSVAVQLRAMDPGDRDELYAHVGIKAGMSAADVIGLLSAKWGELDLLAFEDANHLDVEYLLSEIRVREGTEEES